VPGEKQVGSVSIRVVPDTTRFKAELERQLASIKDLKITANLDLDKGAAQAELDRISAERPTITANLDLDTGAAEIQKALLKRPVKIPAQVDINQSEVARAAAKLKAVHIPADVDNRNLQSLVGKAFAGIKPQHIPADVQINKDSLAALLKPIDELHTVKVKVQADIDRAAIAREMETLHLKAQLDVDTANFHKALADAEAGFKKFDSLKASPDFDRSKISRGLADIKILGQDVFSSMGRAASAVGDNFKDAFDGVSGLAGVAPALLKVSAIAAAIAVGGAAITAAWGAASTAIAAVPAAIGLIGAPLATVALGMDGIKKAASALAPEFNKLKSAVSSTFQSGLKPVFDQLKGTMTALTPQIQAVATSMVGLAQQTANFITTGGGLQLTQTLFTNVAAAIKQIDLVPLLDGFLKLAGNQSALQALTTTINELGIQIKAIADNTSLDAAFKGLEGTLQAVTKGFGSLVNNGIKLFAAAAPGVNQVVESITGFFNRFDWNSLGTSVSGVFSGIATAIDGIKPATITGIETAFSRLSDVFKDPGFQANIQKVADALPAVIDQVGNLTSALGDFAGGAGQLITAFDTIDQGFQKFQLSLDGIAKDLGNSLFGNDPDPLGLNALNDLINEKLGITVPQSITQGITRSTQAAEHAEAELGPAVQKGFTDAFNGVPNAVQQGLAQVPVVTQEELAKVGPIFSQVLGTVPQLASDAFGLVPPAAQTALNPLIPALGSIAQGANSAFVGPVSQLPGQVGPTFGQIPTLADTALAPLPGLFADKANAARLGFGTGIKNISPETAQQLGLLGPAVTTGLTPAQDAAAAGATAMTTAFTTALLPLGQAFTTITPQITAFGAALTAMNPQLLAFGTTFTTLNPQILAFGTTLTTLNPQMLALGTTFTTLNPQILAFGTTLTTLNPQILAFGTTLTTLNPQILAFGTTLTTLNPQLLAFGTTLTTLNPQMLALGTTFTTLNPALLAFGTTLTTLNPQILALGTSLTTLNPQLLAFSTAFTTINPALLAFGTSLTTAAAQATAFGAAVTAAFTLVNTTITTSMTTAVTSVTTGFTQMVQAATQGGTQIVQAGTTAMNNFVTAIKNGMTQATAAAKAGVSAIVAALNAGASQAQAAGVNLGKAFVSGIESQVSAARAAGAKLGQAAVDGINSAKGIKTGSPSKKGIASGENLGGAFAIGMANLEAKVSSSGASLGSLAAESILDNTPDISANLLDTLGLSGIAAQVDAVFASGDFNLPSSSSKPVIDLGGIKVYVGDREITDIVRVELAADKEDLLLKSRAG
jgi:hypothetical protein